MVELEPIYDVTRTYEDNYAQGPFGAFAQALHTTFDAVDTATTADTGVSSAVEHADITHGQDAESLPHESLPHESLPYTVLGHQVRLPFGIPAGPLLNSKFTTAALRMDYDMVVYKTVRSRPWACNPFPNVLAVHPSAHDGVLRPESRECDEGILADTHYQLPVSISNSFGVPSQDPEIWQPDLAQALSAVQSGQVVIPSFQGSRTAGMSTEDYIADHVLTARLVQETGATMMEMNTSCPNEGHNRLLCHDPELVGRICEAVKEQIGDIPLVVKLAYIPDNDALETMIAHTVSRGTVQGFATINTISAKLVDAQGRQALPGEGRERSGVCGAAIRQAGLNMVTRLADIRERMGLDMTIIGVGGVTNAQDYHAYRVAGADAVMSATGAMFNPYLAQEILEQEGIKH